MGDNTVSRQNFPAFPNVIAQDRTDKQPEVTFSRNYFCSDVILCISKT